LKKLNFWGIFPYNFEFLDVLIVNDAFLVADYTFGYFEIAFSYFLMSKKFQLHDLII
jgi:hypothetical protein